MESKLDSDYSRSQVLAFGEAHGVATTKDLISYPRYIQIETVSLCNARCIMCPVEEWERDAKIMKAEVFEKIVNDMIPYSQWIERVTAQYDGEPLLDRDLEKRIQRLKEIGIKTVAFSSNSSLMDEKRAKSIVECGVDEVSFSIDGATAPVFESIRRRLKYDVCLNNIKNFVRVRNQLRPNLKIRIRMTIQKANEHEFNDFLTFWKGILGPNDRVYGKRIHNWGNWLEGYNLPANRDRDELNASPCSSPWTSFAIFSDGRVPLCCSDYNAKEKMGNILTHSIQEIWQGEPFSKVRALHESGGRKSMEMCKDCNTWDPKAKIEE